MKPSGTSEIPDLQMHRVNDEERGKECFETSEYSD